MTFFNRIIFVASSICLFSVQSFAQATYDIRVRKPDHQIGVEKLSIPLLLQVGIAETKHFKVVYQFSKDLESEQPAVALDESMDGQRAATLLYHLETAYEKMTKKVGPKILASLGQIIIRLETQNEFSEVGHYIDADINPMYNNITSIPASDDARLEKYKPWGNEIWIRPTRLVSEKTAMATFTDQSKQMREVMVEGTVTSVTAQYAQFSAAYNRFLAPGMHLEQMAVGLAISYALPEFLSFLGKTAKEKRQFDAAMVPEVIYHEFAHLAFSHWLPMGVSTPVTEGYANFIATDLSGLDEIAGNLGEYGKNFTATKVKGTDQYQLMHESLNYSWESFTPKLLVAIKKALGAELGDRVIMESIRNLALVNKPIQQINIRYDLCSAIKDAVKKLSPDAERMLNLVKVNNVYYDFKLIRRPQN